MFKVNDYFYIDLQLNGNRDLPIRGTQNFKLEMIESIDYLLPTIKLDYSIPIPVFYQKNPVTGMELLSVEAGRDKADENLQTFDYRLLSAYPEESGDKRETPMFRFRGVLDNVKTLREQKTKGYNDTPSGVVDSIVSPLTTDKNIEQTHKNLNRNWIQPDWSDHKMIRYMKHQSVNTEGLGPYRSFFTRGNQFNFKSIDSLYQQPVNGDTHYLRYAPGGDNKGKRSSDDVVGEQYTDDKFIVDFRYNNDSSLALQQGALGFTVQQYDWDKGGWAESGKNIQDANNHRALTNRLLYNQDDNIDDSYNEFRGRSKQAKREADWYAKSGVIDENLNVNEMNVTLRQRLPYVKAGDVVRVDIFDETIEGNRLDVLSGRWLVHTKKEIINQDFVSKLRLIRDGLNNPDRDLEQFSSADSIAGRIGGGA